MTRSCCFTAFISFNKNVNQMFRSTKPIILNNLLKNVFPIFHLSHLSYCLLSLGVFSCCANALICCLISVSPGDKYVKQYFVTRYSCIIARFILCDGSRFPLSNNSFNSSLILNNTFSIHYFRMCIPNSTCNSILAVNIPQLSIYPSITSWKLISFTAISS